MPNICETHCCGLGDMAGLQYNEEYDEEYDVSSLPSMVDCVMAAWGENVAFVTFAQATFRVSPNIDSPEAVAFYKFANKQGTKLASFIRKHKLGRVMASPVRKNLNSGNDLRVWLWALDRPAIEKWNKARTSNTVA